MLTLKDSSLDKEQYVRNDYAFYGFLKFLLHVDFQILFIQHG